MVEHHQVADSFDDDCTGDTTTEHPGGSCSVDDGLVPMPGDCTGWWECVPDVSPQYFILRNRY
jgi:hypothetical protein